MLIFIGHLVLDRMSKVSKNQFSTLFVWNTVYSFKLYYKLVHTHFISSLFSVSRPTRNELICLKRRDGSGENLRIIHWITSHKPAVCVDFAHLLLNDEPSVRLLTNKHSDNEEFVRAVLDKWLERDDEDKKGSLPCTWESLVQCVKDAGLSGNFLNLLKANVPGGEC